MAVGEFALPNSLFSNDWRAAKNGGPTLQVGEETFGPHRANRGRKQVCEKFIKFVKAGRVVGRVARRVNCAAEAVLANFFVTFEAHCKIRQGPSKIGDTRPIRQPKRYLPSAD